MRLMRTGDDWPHMHDGAQVTLLGQRALILRQVRGQCRAWAQDTCQVDAILIATHQPVAPMRCLLGSFAIIEVADGDRIVAVATMVEADTMQLKGCRQRALRQRSLLDSLLETCIIRLPRLDDLA